MVSEENRTALHRIMKHLRRGGFYTEPVVNVKYPYDKEVLYKTNDPHYIGWSNYGSSACGNNMRDVNWTIRHIFGMTLAEFVQKYDEKMP